MPASPVSSFPIPPLTVPPGYCPQAEDTSPENDVLDFYLLGRRTSVERLAMAVALMRGARKLSLHCLSRQFANLSPPEFAHKLAEAWLQEDCPPNYIPTGSPMSWIQDSTELAAQLHHLFATVGISYYVTGGVAAITYGEPRTTRDLDAVMFIAHGALPPLVRALEGAGFYVPGVEDVLSGAMKTLQVTHMESISRADLVLATDNDYERLKFQRRRLMPWPNGTEVYLASPEDLVISKLRWGQGRQSEKQWRDVLGILKIQREQLDYNYLYAWAVAFDLAVTLEQATVAAGVKAIASHQWATALYAALAPLIAGAGDISTGGISVGQDYLLMPAATPPQWTLMALPDHRPVAQWDSGGTVLEADPTVGDRQSWPLSNQGPCPPSGA